MIFDIWILTFMRLIRLPAGPKIAWDCLLLANLNAMITFLYTRYASSIGIILILILWDAIRIPKPFSKSFIHCGDLLLIIAILLRRKIVALDHSLRHFRFILQLFNSLNV